MDLKNLTEAEVVSRLGALSNKRIYELAESQELTVPPALSKDLLIQAVYAAIQAKSSEPAAPGVEGKPDAPSSSEPPPAAAGTQFRAMAKTTLHYRCNRRFTNCWVDLNTADFSEVELKTLKRDPHLIIRGLPD